MAKADSSIGALPLQTNVHQKNAVEESRRLIDQKIAMHEQSILQLKFQRNELAPSSRLPPEVLGAIFVATQYGRGRPSPSRFNFSHVCRLWRNVALAVPDIWCFIPLHRQKRATAMLERSKSADLVLNLDFTTLSATSPRGEFMKNVLDNYTSRIRELSLKSGSSRRLSTFLHDIQPSSFRLRSLQVVGGYDHAPSFPISIIANSEGLLDLVVVRYDIAWCSMPLTGLTSLEMDSNPTRPLWSDFIRALGAMPSLAGLQMQDSLPLADDLYRRTSNPIRLTKLRRLDLLSTTDINEVLNVLSYIVVPQVASIKIRGRNNTPQNTSLSLVSGFASLLSAFISEMISEDSHPMFYQELNVISTYSLLELTAWRRDCKPDGIRRTSSPDLEFSISGFAHWSDEEIPLEVGEVPLEYEEVPLEFIKHPSLSKLKSLSLSAVAYKDTLLECFGGLQELRSVTLKGGVIRGFLRMLMVENGRDPNSYYQVTCPALQSLEIRNAGFYPHCELTFEELRDCLMERCNRNAELGQLIIFDCNNLYDKEVELLREIVVDVNIMHRGKGIRRRRRDDEEILDS